MKSLIQKMKKYKNVLFSLLLTIWAIIAFYLLQDIVFESNDDNGMALLAYGYRGNYETHLVYINVIIGYALKFFLQLFPDIPWYTVFQCAVIVTSFFSITYLFLHRFGIKKGVLPTFVLFLFFSSQFFTLIQFSKTAGIACLAGLLLVFDGVQTESKSKAWKYILGSLLTIVGSLYRFNVLGMMLIILFGVGLYIVWKPLKEKNFKEILRICVPFVLIITICFGCRYYDKWSYKQSDEWINYREFNSLRSELLDYGFPDYSENKELYESLNISKTDYEMFSNWNFADPEVFSIETMRKLVDAKGETKAPIGNYLEAIKTLFFNYSYSAAIIIAIIVWLLNYQKQRIFPLFYTIAAITVLELYLAMEGRYAINRIDASIACAAFCVIVLYAWSDFSISKKWLSVIMAIAILCCPFVNYNEPQKITPVDYYELVKTDKEHLYIRVVGSGLPSLPRPSEIEPEGYQSNSCSLGGWATYTPSYLDIWENYEITNPYRDIVDNDSIYLVSSEAPKESLQYIRNHYAPDSQLIHIKTTKDGYPIYRVTTTAGPVVDTSVARFVEGEEFTYSAKATVDPNNGNITIKGYFYGADMNSFASNIYVGVKGADGVEQLYFTKQGYASKLKDHMNGAYGKYSCSLPAYSDTTEFTLYLELNGSLYAVNMGAVNRYIEAQ